MNHYVYLIEKKNSLSNREKYYIGVRSFDGKIGEDDYMGSSKYLTEDIETEGINQFNKIILKRFDNREDAMKYEIKMHEHFDVARNHFFFNKAKQKTIGFSSGPGELNPFYGKKHTEEYKRKLSALLKTKDCRSKTPNIGLKHTEETKLIMSLKRKEWMSKNKHPMIGKSRKNDINFLMGMKNQKRTSCQVCGIISTSGNITRWHNNNCKKGN